jgi:transposase InsO family protein
MDINHLHRISGHTNFQLLQKTVSKGGYGGVTTLTGIPKLCEACILGKMKRLPFPRSKTVARGPLDIVSADVGGPVTPEGPGGIRYWVVLVDHYTSTVWVLLAKKKSEVYTLLKDWRKQVESRLRNNIAHWEFCEGWTRFFRTDGGGEFTSKEMEAEFRKQGIIHETTAPYTPEQNGIAERMNQTLVTRATTMLVDSRLPRRYWTWAMLAAAYTINRTPTSSQNGRIPHEIMYDRPVNVQHLHRWGCRAYPHIPDAKRAQKFGDKAQRCVFVGYFEDGKAYQLLVINKDGTYGELVKSRDVRFDDDQHFDNYQSPLESRVSSTKDLEQMSQVLRRREHLILMMMMMMTLSCPTQAHQVQWGSLSQWQYTSLLLFHSNLLFHSKIFLVKILFLHKYQYSLHQLRSKLNLVVAHERGFQRSIQMLYMSELLQVHKVFKATQPQMILHSMALRILLYSWHLTRILLKKHTALQPEVQMIPPAGMLPKLVLSTKTTGSQPLMRKSVPSMRME